MSSETIPFAESWSSSVDNGNSAAGGSKSASSFLAVFPVSALTSVTLLFEFCLVLLCAVAVRTPVLHINYCLAEQGAWLWPQP